MRSRGNIGESMAKNFLIKNNYEILAENYIFHRRGEIDIIALDYSSNQVCAIEVKLRKGSQFGTAIEAFTSKKFERIYASLQQYALENNISENLLRIDLIAISQSNNTHIEHIKNIGFF